MNSLYVRQAGLSMLKAAAPAPGPIPADSMYPQQRPANVAWPFLGWGAPVETPFIASGMDGSTVTVSVHVFAETTGTGDDTLAGEEAASLAVAWIVARFGGEDGAEVSLADTDCPHPATAYFIWTGSQVIQDGTDANAFHGWATFDVTVSS